MKVPLYVPKGRCTLAGGASPRSGAATGKRSTRKAMRPGGAPHRVTYRRCSLEAGGRGARDLSSPNNGHTFAMRRAAGAHKFVTRAELPVAAPLRGGAPPAKVRRPSGTQGGSSVKACYRSRGKRVLRSKRVP